MTASVIEKLPGVLRGRRGGRGRSNAFAAADELKKLRRNEDRAARVLRCGNDSVLMGWGLVGGMHAELLDHEFVHVMCCTDAISTAQARGGNCQVLQGSHGISPSKAYKRKNRRHYIFFLYQFFKKFYFFFIHNIHAVFLCHFFYCLY